MTRFTARLLGLTLGLLLAGTVALAQTCYPLAEPVRPAPGDEVRVRLLGGLPFAGRAMSLADRDGMRLERLWRSGRAELGPAGQDGSVSFRPTEPGVELIAIQPRQDTGSAGGERSFGKALLVVGTARPGQQIWRSELGQQLEIVPETDPVLLAEKGGEVRIQILFEREPLAQATVVAVAENALAESYRQGVTDTLGRVRFDLDRPGRWLIHLAHKSFEEDAPGWSLYQSGLLVVSGP